MVTGRRGRGGLENVAPHENLSGLVGCNGGDEKMGTVIYAKKGSSLYWHRTHPLCADCQ